MEQLFTGEREGTKIQRKGMEQLFTGQGRGADVEAKGYPYSRVRIVRVCAPPLACVCVRACVCVCVGV